MAYHSRSLIFCILLLSACAVSPRDAVGPAQAQSPVTTVTAATVTAPSRPVTDDNRASSPTLVIIETTQRSAPQGSEAMRWPPHLPPEPTEIPALQAIKRPAAAQSPAIAPPKWDAAAYRRDPQSYLDEAFPGRANQTAQPSADVPFLVADGPIGFRVAPLSRVVLRARGEPWMPVTFTSLGLGTFLRNGLTTVSVPADGEGLAQATWIATPGTVGNVSILAGSPTRAGQVSYLIHIAE